MARRTASVTSSNRTFGHARFSALRAPRDAVASADNRPEWIVGHSEDGLHAGGRKGTLYPTLAKRPSVPQRVEFVTWRPRTFGPITRVIVTVPVPQLRRPITGAEPGSMSLERFQTIRKASCGTWACRADLGVRLPFADSDELRGFERATELLRVILGGCYRRCPTSTLQVMMHSSCSRY